MRLQLILLLALTSTAVAQEAPADDAMEATEPSPWAASLDALVYADTDAVQIYSPQASVRYRLDPDGGAVSARATVDVISAASVDVVSQATPHFDEVRYQADLAASKAFGDHTPGLAYRFSIEPDYLSHGIGGSLQSRLGTPDSVLALGYDLTLDTVTRSGSPNAAFEESLTTHTANIGLTQVLSSRSLVRLVYTFTAQNGYMEKVYRHVPLFTAAAIARAQADGVPLGLDNFDQYRLSERPPEEVPDRRLRHAIALRAMHYVPSAKVALRLDYQFYVDDWGLLAHVLEPSVRWQVSDRVELGAFARGYRQNAASFWRRTYVVDDAGSLPEYRTADRDLSPYTAMTVGGRVGWSNRPWSFYVESSVVQTFYDDFLYRDRLTALVSQVGVSWTP